MCVFGACMCVCVCARTCGGSGDGTDNSKKNKAGGKKVKGNREWNVLLLTG